MTTHSQANNTLADNLFDKLIQSAILPHLDKIDEDVKQMLLKEIFASFLTQCINDDKLAWYQQFVKATKSSANTALITGGAMPSVDTKIFWTHDFHQKLVVKLAKAFFIPQPLIKTLLPLLVHRLFYVIGQDKDAIKSLIDNHKADIASYLPLWIMPMIDKTVQAYFVKSKKILLDSLIDQALSEPADSDTVSLTKIGEVVNLDNLTNTDDLADLQDNKHKQNNNQNSNQQNNNQSTNLHHLNDIYQKSTYQDSNYKNNILNDNLNADNLNNNRLTDNDLKNNALNNSELNNAESNNNHSDDNLKTAVLDNQSSQVNDNKQDNQNDISDNLTLAKNKVPARLSTKPKPKAGFFIIVLPILCLLGFGVWYFVQKQKTDNTTATTPEVLPVPTVQSLPPSSIRLTVGENGALYACQAELGSKQVADDLLKLLNDNFMHTMCVIDTSSGVTQAVAGFDKLTSAIGILKTARFASIELVGDSLYVNAPNNDDVARLVRDIGALFVGSGVKVVAMPALDKNLLIETSLQRAKSALANLAQNASDYELARAMSLQMIDVSAGTIPQVNQELLRQFAERLVQNPNIRLIIVAHSDTSKNRDSTQMDAELVKSALMSMGVADGQLVAQGVGADFPIADNQTDIGRFKNNRIEFLVYDEPTIQALTARSEPAPQMTMPTDMPMNTPMNAELDMPMNAGVDGMPSPPVNQPMMPSQPTFGVQNGQIVEIPNNMPPPIQPQIQPQMSMPSSNIPDDLLTPIGSDPAGGVPDI